MDTARKAYSQSAVDPKRVYNERRSFIGQRLQGMLGHQLQNCINALNEDMEGLKVEIQEIEAAISQLREGKDPEVARHKFRVSYSISGRPENVIQVFENEIEWRRGIMRWIQREKQIFFWERTRRKMAAAKLPMMRQQLKGLNEEAHRLLCKMKSSAEQLTEAIAAHQKTHSEYYMLKGEIEKLTFNREPPEDRTWANVSVPTELKELKFFRDLEVREESKGLCKLFNGKRG